MGMVSSTSRNATTGGEHEVESLPHVTPVAFFGDGFLARPQDHPGLVEQCRALARRSLCTSLTLARASSWRIMIAGIPLDA